VKSPLAAKWEARIDLERGVVLSASQTLAPDASAPHSAASELGFMVHPHSGLQRDFRWLSHRKSVTLSVGTLYLPAVLPTAGPIDYPLPVYSRNPFLVRCVVERRSSLIESSSLAGTAETPTTCGPNRLRLGSVTPHSP